MELYSKDRIFFSWIPRKCDHGYCWLTWIDDLLVSRDGKNYEIVSREQYIMVMSNFFRSDEQNLPKPLRRFLGIFLFIMLTLFYGLTIYPYLIIKYGIYRANSFMDKQVLPFVMWFI